MFSDYCPIILAEASNGDVIEFFSDRNEEKGAFRSGCIIILLKFTVPAASPVL